jgi:uncharacterized protein YjbI with pentapeptide repeats
MHIQKMRARWTSPEGRENLTRVLECLKKGKTLGNLDFINTHKGRLDLRGFTFPDCRTEEKFSIDGYEVELLEEVPVFKKTIVANADFSGGKLGPSIWKKCTFKNVLFDEANLSGFKARGCRFDSVSFLKADVRGAAFLRLKRQDTILQNVTFRESDMRTVVFDMPMIEGCDFSFANLKKVNFSGSRFKNCKFAGLVEEVFFRGYNPYQRRKIRNPMESIDFSEAELRNVAFRDEIDLSKVKFPKDEECLVLYNQREVYLKARKVIEREWTGDHRKWALGLMKNLYLKESKKGQHMDFYNKKDDMKYFGEEYANRFFSLLKESQRKVLQEKGST